MLFLFGVAKLTALSIVYFVVMLCTWVYLSIVYLVVYLRYFCLCMYTTTHVQLTFPILVLLKY
jgi:hypothetical protein